jgi:hypothetical protein
MDLVDVYKSISTNFCIIYILLSTPWNFLQNGSYLRAQSGLSKYKKLEIIPSILSNHNALKLELNNKNSSRKHANNCKLNNTLLNDQVVINEIKEEINMFLVVIKNENKTNHIIWDTAKEVLKESL